MSYFFVTHCTSMGWTCRHSCASEPHKLRDEIQQSKTLRAREARAWRLTNASRRMESNKIIIRDQKGGWWFFESATIGVTASRIVQWGAQSPEK
eukprot:5612574-Amphidinium_carterae.1